MLLCALAGCFPSREDIYREIGSSHLALYEEWHRGEALSELSLLQEGGELTLQRALELAMGHSQGIKDVLQEKEKARWRIVEAYGMVTPSVLGSASYTRVEERPGSALATPNSYAAGVTVTQPIFDSGAIGAAMRGATVYNCLADEQVRQEVQTVAYQVAHKYWEYRLATQLFEVQQAGLESSERQLKDVEAKLEQGLSTEFDRLRAQVEVANFRTAMIQERNKMQLSRAQLFREIGISQRSEAVPSEPFSFLPLTLSFEEAVRIALQKRPDLFKADMVVRLQKEAKNLIRSGLLPRLDAFLSKQWSRPDPTTYVDKWGSLWSAGLSLTWPLSMGTYGQMQEQNVVIRQSEIQRTDTFQKALLEVRQALLDLENAQEQVKAQELNQESARRAEELAVVAKESGVRTDLEVMDARAARVRAQGLYYQALYAHTIARMDLEKALGLLAPEPGTSEVPGHVPVPGRLEHFATDTDLPDSAAPGPVDVHEREGSGGEE